MNAPRASVLVLAVTLALALAGCSATMSEDPTTAAEPNVAEPAAQVHPDPDVAPPSPEVPDKIGESAADAQAEIEDEGFTVTFDPDEPSDASDCTVDDQDPIGEADEGTDVMLTITCEVPDVTGMDGQSAVEELESANFAWAVDDCYDDLSACSVADQDFFEAQPGDEVSLTIESTRGDGGGGDPSCAESYPDECLSADAYDYDCADGEGDGPEYVTGPITVDHAVSEPDPFELDRDGDGTGCDDY